jgi:N-acetylmuramoyl-L-alanine amidase
LTRTVSVFAIALLCAIATVVALAQSRRPADPPIRSSPVDVLATPGKAVPAARALDPALFSPGSCVEFAPTSGNRHQTVFLDAGHGGPDPGGQGVNQAGQVITERELTLPVVLEATALLRAQGFTVVDSRTTGSAVIRLGPADVHAGLFSLAGKHRDTAARPLCANLAKADLLVSVHFNVGATPSNAGAETTYDAVRPFSARSKSFADLLQASITAALHAVSGWHVPDNGVVTDDLVGNSLTSRGAAYGHLLVLGPAAPPYFSTASTMPGALTEPLYLTDPFEGTIASSPTGQKLLAAAIAKAVEQFLPGPAG